MRDKFYKARDFAPADMICIEGQLSRRSEGVVANILLNDMGFDAIQ
jgi:hypothetical protein